MNQNQTRMNQNQKIKDQNVNQGRHHNQEKKHQI